MFVNVSTALEVAAASTKHSARGVFVTVGTAFAVEVAAVSTMHAYIWSIYVHTGGGFVKIGTAFAVLKSQLRVPCIQHVQTLVELLVKVENTTTVNILLLPLDGLSLAKRRGRF